MATIQTPATAQSTLADLIPGFPSHEEMPTMHVRKRNGALEPVDVNKIVRAVQRSSYGLNHVDAIRIASKTIGGLYDGATYPQPVVLCWRPPQDIVTTFHGHFFMECEKGIR